MPPVPHPGLVTNNVPVALQDWQALGFCHQPDMNASCEPNLKQGAIDHYVPPPASEQPSFRALSASDDDGHASSACYRGMSGVASAADAHRSKRRSSKKV